MRSARQNTPRTRLLVLVLCLLTGSPIGRPKSSAVSSVEPQPIPPRYVPYHLIVGFRPGVLALTEPVTRAEAAPYAFLRDLAATMGLREIIRMAPSLPPPPDRRRASEALAQRAPRSYSEVALLLERYGLDRLALLRFAHPIDPVRWAQTLLRRYPEEIEFAEPDYVLRSHHVPNDPLFGQQWYLRDRNVFPERRADIWAPEAWDITTGRSDVVIAVIDTGIDASHPDLARKLFVNPGEIPNNGVDDDRNGFVDDVSGWDFVRGDPDPDDENGHGTWMSSLAAAETNNAVDIAGVGWESRLLPLKAGDERGNFPISTLTRAITYAVTMAPFGVRVINMSLGGPGTSPALERALAAANDARLIAIAAAGNEGQNNDVTSHLPSYLTTRLDNVVAVAATDRFNQLASFSNYGRLSVDVGAPGVGILGLTTRNTSAELGRSEGTIIGNGTSQATALVSGIAALIFSAYPESTPIQVKIRLLANVDRIPELANRVISGGRVNAFRALERDDVPPAPITDLRLLTDVTSLTLTWTATGDDGLLGRAAFYDIRYSPSPITANTLRFATRVKDPPRPQPAGTIETWTLPPDIPPRTYYFLIRVFDNAGNMAESNQVEVTITR
jgi:subtilisin family serine protease